MARRAPTAATKQVSRPPAAAFSESSVSYLHILLTWLHLLAAISWIGGMIFLSLVLAPIVRSRKAAPEFMALFRSAARRFRFVVWSAIALLLSTGPMLLRQKGLSVIDPAAWPQVLWIKLGLVAALLFLTFLHELLLGPRMRTLSAIPADAGSSWERLMLHAASWVPRAAMLLALGVVFAAAVLARS